MTTAIEILKNSIQEAQEIIGASVDEQPIVVRQKAVELLSETIDNPGLAGARDRESRNLLADCRTARVILKTRIGSELQKMEAAA